MKLFEIANEFKTLYDIATEEEDVETLSKLYDELEMKLEDKAENVRIVLMQLKADEELLSDEIKRLQTRKKSIAKNRENLKSLLAWTLQSAGVPKLKTPKATFYFTNTKSVAIEDVEKLPQAFVKIEKKPLKTELKKALLNGETIEGATLEETQTLNIR